MRSHEGSPTNRRSDNEVLYNICQHRFCAGFPLPLIFLKGMLFLGISRGQNSGKHKNEYEEVCEKEQSSREKK